MKTLDLWPAGFKSAEIVDGSVKFAGLDAGPLRVMAKTRGCVVIRTSDYAPACTHVFRVDSCVGKSYTLTHLIGWRNRS